MAPVHLGSRRDSKIMANGLDPIELNQQHGGWIAAALLLATKVWNRLSMSSAMREVRESVRETKVLVSALDGKVDTLAGDVNIMKGRLMERDSAKPHRAAGDRRKR